MPMSSTLQTERLAMRRLTLDDAAFMLQIWNDPAFIRNVGDRGIRSDSDARRALRDGVLKSYRQHGFGPYRLSLLGNDAGIGICGLFQRDHLDAPDIGFSLLPDYWRQGYAYEAAVAVIDDARKHLSLPHLTAIVSAANQASIGLIERLGLVFERSLSMPGESQSVCLYGIEWPEDGR